MLSHEPSKNLRDWMGLPLYEITKTMVAERHRALADRPSAANHTLKFFRTVWNHARRTHDLPECPTMAIEGFDKTPNGTIIENLADDFDDRKAAKSIFLRR